ncbi:occludin-like, partial [Pseudonaja textilis]|uniref:occludin-like n=1 Tax=Pseudonaja textilis TaxID=8673 RepID=UPI000EA98DA9
PPLLLPAQAVAIVCGFLLVVLLCVICFFAHKTRHKIWQFGKQNIYWDRPPALEGGPNVEEWVKNVDGRASPTDTATLAYSEKPTSPVHAPASPPSYTEKDGFSRADGRISSPFQPPLDKRARTLSSSTWEEPPRKAPAQRSRRARRGNPDPEEAPYETDYTTAVESSDEQEPDEWDSHYPPIMSDDARQRYKQDFDTDLKRYKRLCGEMDAINDQINQLSRQLDQLPEDTLQYQGVAEEYNRL